MIGGKMVAIPIIVKKVINEETTGSSQTESLFEN